MSTGSIYSPCINCFLCLLAVCTTTYAQQDRRYIGGEQQSGANTEPACRALCTGNRDCTSYDYDSAQGENQRCWAFFLRYDENLPNSPDNVVDHYSKRRTCGGKCCSSAACMAQRLLPFFLPHPEFVGPLGGIWSSQCNRQYDYHSWVDRILLVVILAEDIQEEAEFYYSIFVI